MELHNDGSGLGFGIVGGRSTGVIVKTILPGGVADRVSIYRGRLEKYFLKEVTCNNYLLEHSCYNIITLLVGKNLQAI